MKLMKKYAKINTLISKRLILQLMMKAGKMRSLSHSIKIEVK